MLKRSVGVIAAAGGLGLGVALLAPDVFSTVPLQPRVAKLEVLPSRNQHFSSLAGASRDNPFDILIIGGGATGAGCAVDATTRGLRTALVEGEDFGAGTSSRSTKLIHGGVRYLEKAVFNLDYGQLHLVFDALRERKTMLRNAPHLSNPLPIMTPCYKWWEVPYYWAGLKAYDLVAGFSNLTLSSFVGPHETMRLFPTLASVKQGGQELKGSIIYYDGQFDDARMNVALACTAAQYGATVANHTRCEGLLKDQSGAVVGATLRDVLTGETCEVHARTVINAGGPFSDSVRRLSNAAASTSIMPSAGVHLTLPDYYSPEALGMIVPKTADGRVVFMLPWQGYTIAGTTDSSTEVTMTPTPTEDEVGFILGAIEEYLNIRVRRADVQSAWSGIRPLALDPHAPSTEGALRDHIVYSDPDGLISVSGGKWTTYRKMAEDAVDAAEATGRLGPAGACCTATLPVLGAEGYHRGLFAHLSQGYHVPHRTGYVAPDVARHLAASYGDRAFEVTKLAEERQLGRRIVPWHNMIEAEVPYAVRNEYCCTAVDFLARRTRLAFLDTHASLQALPKVVELMGAELNWSRGRRREETNAAKAFLKTFQ